MTQIKICGITNKQDALTSANLGADALGFIFYKKSPRFVSAFKAKKIIESLPPFVTPVGVFVNQKEEEIRDIARSCGISTIQLHGDEPPAFCQRLKSFKVIKAFRVNDSLDWKMISAYSTVSAFLFDTFQENQYGGSGKVFNWGLLKDQKLHKPFILSGGLTARNVIQAISLVNPYAVDVSSGVEESAGKKSERRLIEFFGALKERKFLSRDLS